MDPMPMEPPMTAADGDDYGGLRCELLLLCQRHILGVEIGGTMDSTVGRWNRRNGGVCRQIALANTLEDVIKMARLPTKVPIPPIHSPLTFDLTLE